MIYFCHDLSRWRQRAWQGVYSGCRMRHGRRWSPICLTASRENRAWDDRTVISGILHVLKTGCRWRDVPSAFGPPTTIYNRYNRWSQRRIWQRIFEKMAAAGPVPDELSIDSRHVKAHRSAAGSKRGSSRKRLAVRAAGTSKSMLWPMIAAARSRLR